MNCSYRILKNVNIGMQVRKTADKNTVPFSNEPMTGMKILSWNKQGFVLTHPDLPEVKYHGNRREIWLDFNQLPLDKLNIEMGIIKNPLTFVESIIGGSTTSMVLLRADTYDYLELLDDKKSKDEAIKYKPSQLKPGDQVISCLCREGNAMIFLGKFVQVDVATPSSYSYYYDRNRETKRYISSTVERYFFAYPQKDGTYNIVDYPLTNKTVVELYMAKDKGKDFIESRFDDLEINREIILNSLLSKTSDSLKYPDSYLNYKDGIEIKEYNFIKNKSNYHTIYIGKSKENIRDIAYEFYVNNINTKKALFKTEEEFQAWRNQGRY